MQTCPLCHNDASEDLRFCPSCGFDFHSESRQAGETQSFSAQETKKMPSVFTEITEANKLVADRFLLQDKLGEGGMSVVFKAQDTLLDEAVALKILKPAFTEDHNILKRFKREVKIARKITHPNICRIYDIIFLEDIKCICMEYVEGVSLATVADDQDFSYEKRLVLITGILAGLRAAHMENVIHRDLKPSNIMINGQFRPKIMDFGISRLSGIKGESDITKKGEILGTVEYMAPEQFQGKKLDNRSDIYSLGIMLYKLFTGKLPFHGTNSFAIAMAHIESHPLAPEKVNPDITGPLSQLIMKCVEKKPEARFQTVEEIIDTLRNQPLVVTQSDSRKKIVVAEDSADIRNLLKRVLETADYNVIFAENGQEAIAQCIQYKPDLLCTDIMMPHMDGLQSIEFLLDNPVMKDLPIIVISGRSEKDYIAYCKSLGVREYIVKPFDPFTVLPLIQEILHD